MLTADDMSVMRVAEMVAADLGTSADDVVICDGRKFEIVDSESTRGTLVNKYQTILVHSCILALHLVNTTPVT